MDGVEINTVTSLDNGREKDNASAGQLSQSVSKKKKAGARVSVVWDHFTKDGTSGSGDPKASCNYCGQQYCCDPKTNGTSSMLHHLNKCKKYPYKEVEKKQRCLLFYDVTLKISGSSCSTLNEFFHLLVEIQGELEELHSSRDKHLHTMAGKIKRKCETFWGNEVNFFVYVAIVLDPRFKLDYVKCCFKEIYGESKGYEMLMKVKAFLGRLFDFYSNHVLGLSMETETPSAIIARKELQVKGCSFPVLRRIQSQFRRYVQEVDSLNNRPELEKYLGEGTLNVPSDFLIVTGDL
ncbi:hAT-like transposase, RNase-H fold [Dillenia turbinata]|uniref:HAT-like transposase, RNase-H fold n=1 Tax=Dillenia turbinata TaxID=194707 RepID=A0AAN8V2M2_9MAGN